MIGIAGPLSAQSAPAQLAQDEAIVTFEVEWPDADPQWYQLSIDSAGRAVYQSQPHLAPGETPGEPYILKFNVSRQCVEEVFRLAGELQYFHGQFDDLGRKVAQTGAKTLGYQDDTRSERTTYNASTNRQLSELTTLMQNIAGTLELDGKLRYALRFDHLGVEALLKSMEEMNKSGELAELQAVAPTLREIANDPAMMGMTRNRARRLLAAARVPASAARP